MHDKKLMLLIVLSVLAVVSLIYGIATPSKYRRGGNPSQAEVSPQETTTVSLKNLYFGERQRKRSDYVVWSRNPFFPKASSSQTVASSLVLNGIAWDEKFPQAVINNRIVRAGEQIGGNKVVKIERSFVVLNDGVNQFELRLGRKK